MLPKLSFFIPTPVKVAMAVHSFKKMHFIDLGSIKVKIADISGKVCIISYKGHVIALHEKVYPIMEVVKISNNPEVKFITDAVVSAFGGKIIAIEDDWSVIYDTDDPYQLI